jgi:hypothetical protein
VRTEPKRKGGARDQLGNGPASPGAGKGRPGVDEGKRAGGEFTPALHSLASAPTSAAQPTWATEVASTTVVAAG